VHSFSHPDYEIKWPEKAENKEKRVLIAIRKNLLIKVMMEAYLDLVNHSYVLALDIWDLQPNTQKKARGTRLINCYNNRISLNTTYYRNIDSNKRAIDDINWENLIQGRAILLSDFNAYSPY
jgi:hypothetical protein